MSANGHLKASEVRARVDHPIIDADGHWLEYGPMVGARLNALFGSDTGHFDVPDMADVVLA